MPANSSLEEAALSLRNARREYEGIQNRAARGRRLDALYKWNDAAKDYFSKAADEFINKSELSANSRNPSYAESVLNDLADHHEAVAEAARQLGIDPTRLVPPFMKFRKLQASLGEIDSQIASALRNRFIQVGLPIYGFGETAPKALEWRWFIVGCVLLVFAIMLVIWGFSLGTLTSDQQHLLVWALALSSGFAAGAFAGSFSAKARDWIPGLAITATGGFGVWLLTFFFLFPQSKVTKETPSPLQATPTVTATASVTAIPADPVSDILVKCHTRALNTRTPLEVPLSGSDMFDSIEKSREAVWAALPKIHDDLAKHIATELHAILDAILRRRPPIGTNIIDNYHIDELKKSALNALQRLAQLTGGRYDLLIGGGMASETYFTQAEVDTAIPSAASASTTAAITPSLATPTPSSNTRAIPLSSETPVSQNDAALPGDTGWIFVGYYSPDDKRWNEGPYVSLPEKQNSATLPIEIGDQIEVSVPRRYIIVDYKLSGFAKRMTPPTEIPGGVLRDIDETGFTINKGTRLVVRDVSVRGYLGHPSAYWLRIASADHP